MKQLFFLIAMANTLCLQAQQNVNGLWVGKLNVSVEIRLAFRFNQDSNGGITATMESPDQNVSGIPCSEVIVNGDSIKVVVQKVNGAYNGKIINNHEIKGKWMQRGNEWPLVLAKTDTIIIQEKPQTPKPPYAYNSEDVLYYNADKSIEFGATITIPNSAGKFPAIVMITGSGAQDRNETIAGHKSFAVIADQLTKNGFIVLRVDDRGIGKTTGDFATSTSQDFANDVEAGLNYLISRKETNTKKLGLIGHSEGGMIAPIVATKRKDVSFIILLAGPGIKISKLMAEQNAAILKSSGIKEEAANAYANFFEDAMPAVAAAKDSATAVAVLQSKLTAWKASTSKQYVTATTGAYNDASEQKYIAAITKTLYTPWYKYFLQFDPQPYLQQLNCKVLALNGSKDIQVLPASNLAGIEAALKKSNSKKYDVMQMEGLNHLFQTCKKCTVAEYAELDETIAPKILDTITNWLKQNVK